MNKKKKPIKKTVVVTQKKQKLKPTSSRQRTTSKQVKNEHPLIFGRENYKYMLIGILLIALGMVLMIGGAMPSPDVWDDSIIYSFRRTVLAPFLIIAGLIVEIYAIFKD